MNKLEAIIVICLLVQGIQIYQMQQDNKRIKEVIIAMFDNQIV